MNRYAPLLHNPGFRAVWGAAVVSGLGDRIATFALYLLIYDLTGNPMDLGILAATQIIPAIVLGPVAGLLCDRISRKGIMITSDIASALVVAAIPLVQSSGQVYILATLLGCGRQFTGPARMALLPDVVGRELLGGANSLLMLTRNLVLLAGFFAGGALVAWLGTDPAFWIDSVTFVGSAAILTLWRFHEPERAAPAVASAAGEGGGDATVEVPAVNGENGSLLERIRRLWTDVNVGLSGVLADPGLRLAFGFLAVITFVTAMQPPLVVVFVKRVLGGTDWQLGLIIGAAGLGGILGALGGGLAIKRHRPLRVIAVMTAIDGALLVFFALNRSFGVAMTLFACFGALATLSQIALVTFLQEAAPDDRRGRTFGWLGTVIGPLSLAAVVLGPLAAELVGVVAVLALCGVAELITAAIGLRIRQAAGPSADSAR